MIPAALLMIGTQSGSVISVTRMAPSRKFSMSAGSRITQAVPEAMLSPIATPLSRNGPVSVSRLTENRVRLFCECTVSGRACTRNSSPVRPSLAHSMSIARP